MILDFRRFSIGDEDNENIFGAMAGFFFRQSKI